jgi:tripartite-type tricarboxylate transporter receptor subunit TctC
MVLVSFWFRNSLLGLAALGFTPVANTPEEFTSRIRQEMEKWGKVVRDANLKIE